MVGFGLENVFENFLRGGEVDDQIDLVLRIVKGMVVADGFQAQISGLLHPRAFRIGISNGEDAGIDIVVSVIKGYFFEDVFTEKIAAYNTDIRYFRILFSFGHSGFSLMEDALGAGATGRGLASSAYFIIDNRSKTA